jgi:hypothetical protein
MTITARKTDVIGGSSPTNDAAVDIMTAAPLTVTFTLEGTSAMLFHRWSNEAVAEKAAAAKNSAAKKTDNLESYVYRDESGTLCLPGEYVRMAVVTAAKFRQDPRSPRKSAADLFKAGIVSLTELASLGVKDWDYLDARRVTIQRNGVTRQRPAMNAGWTAEFQFMINTPEYIDSQLLHAVLEQAGRLIGLGDFRPSFGRFLIKSYAVDLQD